MKIINPATEEIIADLAEDSRTVLESKLLKLRKGQRSWSALSLRERIDMLVTFSSLLKDESEKLAKVLTSEVGKPLQQSRNEIAGAQSRIKWLTDNAERFLADEIMLTDEQLEERISYEALGVVCNISAWNYPYLVGVNVFVPALIAGNAVCYKPSEYATLSGLEIERLLKKAGVPADVFQVAIGARQVGQILLELDFDGYYFTGSYNTGKYIYEKVASRMIPCQCELGGKDPLYVADDVADIRSVAAATADGAFYNNGQSCCAVERIYVHEKVYDAYVDEFVKEVKGWKIGDPSDNVYIGPLTRKDQLAVLEQHIHDATSKGATVLAGGRKMDRPGNYFEPTVVTNVDHSMDLMREESFGPVIGIMKVKNDAEAIEKMNDTLYGLTAAVYCQDAGRAKTILSKLDTGTAYWNCCDRVSAAVPWSGRKHSGFGSSLSHAGIRSFTRPKAYHLKG
jgi:acyl-CoA reductase-like NAD-dependent aldehyde dehydrogenase